MWRRRRSEPDPQVEEARLRLEQAQRELEAAKGDDGKVEAVTRRMQDMRRADRFADLMRRALQGRHP